MSNRVVMGVLIVVVLVLAGAGFTWFKKAGTSKLDLAFKSSNIPYIPRVPRKRGSTYKVMSKKKPLFFDDLPQNTYIRKDAQPYVRSLAVIPIVFKSKPLSINKALSVDNIRANGKPELIPRKKIIARLFTGFAPYIIFFKIIKDLVF